MAAQNHHVSGGDQDVTAAGSRLSCEKSDGVIADCSPVEKLSFFGNLITESGSLDDVRLQKILPMRYTRYSPETTPALAHLADFFAATKFLVNGLLAFDRTFEAVTGFKNHIYLLGDETVLDIASCIQKEPGLFASYGAPVFLDILGMTGIIYRFNTAHKFGYPDRCLNQLRLNGWGRKYAIDWRVPSSFKTSPDVDIIASIIAKHRSEYQELASLCAAKSRPLNVDRIHQLNLALPFRIVT